MLKIPFSHLHFLMFVWISLCKLGAKVMFFYGIIVFFQQFSIVFFLLSLFLLKLFHFIFFFNYLSNFNIWLIEYLFPTLSDLSFHYFQFFFFKCRPTALYVLVNDDRSISSCFLYFYKVPLGLHSFPG